MKTPLTVLVLSAVVLTSCGAVRDSRLNPFNWFGRGQSEPVVEGDVNPLIPRRRASVFRQEQDSAYQGWAVGEVSELLIERRPGGAIIRATGVTDRQGPFDLKLVKDEEASDADSLVYTFKAIQQAAPSGTEWSRTVTAAIWLSDNDLAGIRDIRVQGARNSRVSRR